MVPWWGSRATWGRQVCSIRPMLKKKSFQLKPQVSASLEQSDVTKRAQMTWRQLTGTGDSCHLQMLKSPFPHPRPWDRVFKLCSPLSSWFWLVLRHWCGTQPRPQCVLCSHLGCGQPHAQRHIRESGGIKYSSSTPQTRTGGLAQDLLLIYSHWGQDTKVPSMKHLSCAQHCGLGGGDLTHLVPVDPAEQAPSSTPNKQGLEARPLDKPPPFIEHILCAKPLIYFN